MSTRSPQKRGEPVEVKTAVTALLPIEASDFLWRWYDRQPPSVRREARRRFETVVAVERAIDNGTDAGTATKMAAVEIGLTPRTINNWRRMTDGFPVYDWLAALAPQGRLDSRRRQPERIIRALLPLVHDRLRLPLLVELLAKEQSK